MNSLNKLQYNPNANPNLVSLAIFSRLGSKNPGKVRGNAPRRGGCSDPTKIDRHRWVVPPPSSVERNKTSATNGVWCCGWCGNWQWNVTDAGSTCRRSIVEDLDDVGITLESFRTSPALSRRRIHSNNSRNWQQRSRQSTYSLSHVGQRQPYKTSGDFIWQYDCFSQLDISRINPHDRIRYATFNVQSTAE